MTTAGSTTVMRNGYTMIPITIVLSTRNECPYLPVLLDYLDKEAARVIVIDNGSDDSTLSVLQSGRYPNVIKIVRLPYAGLHDHSAILGAKMREARAVLEGWIVNHDSDELMQSIDRFGGLRSEIELADQRGFNAINLQEAVMLPVDATLDSHLKNNLNYYYFRPFPLRLVRIWKAGLSGSMERTGGHRFEGDDLRLSDRELILRHYIVRSQKHALEKYLHRTFSERDLQLGWHVNRRAFTESSLTIPQQGKFLRRLPRFDYPTFDLSAPTRLHFWEWK